MGNFFDGVQAWTEKRLTLRKAKKTARKQKKKTVSSEILSWLDAIVFAVVVVMLLHQFVWQQFIIPSPSMQDTLLIKDVVSVSQLSFGIELYPYGPKVLNRRTPDRDNIITFYNPDFQSKGTFYTILARVIQMATFGFVNIDVDENGEQNAWLLVKRTAGKSGDTVTFIDGNAYIKASGTDAYVNEADFRAENGLSTSPHRTIEPETYTAYNALGRLEGLAEKGVRQTDYPRHLAAEYAALDRNAFFTDYYGYNKMVYEGIRTADPTDAEARSGWAKLSAGLYVPEGYILPLGDNRDNSTDGRYFGPVPYSKVMGYVTGRIWPLGRVKSFITDDR